MRTEHDFLATVPFDLYELCLFQLVARHRNFTRAGEAAGLTQSAITRQIQGMENSLGVQLLERTTRTVTLTAAGRFLLEASSRLIADVEGTWQRLRQEFAGARKVIRVGVSTSIGLACLPGFFHANLRRQPGVGYRVALQSSESLLKSLAAHELDAGVLCPPARLPGALRITHRFDDDFTLIAPRNLSPLPPTRPADLRKWSATQAWLLINPGTNTGRQQRRWLDRQRWDITPAMELDSFDLIINLVSLGMGVSLVPIRALALYGQKRSLLRVPLQPRFRRELVVVVRRQTNAPGHLTQFVENILF